MTVAVYILLLNTGLIINSALFKCIPVWIVNYIASLPLGVKLPKTVVCLHSLQCFTFSLVPHDNQILPPQSSFRPLSSM